VIWLQDGTSPVTFHGSGKIAYLQQQAPEAEEVFRGFRVDLQGCTVMVKSFLLLP
jgi:hypothetical protein